MKAFSFMTHRHLAAAMSGWRQAAAQSQHSRQILSEAVIFPDAWVS